jgi:hypothetical protein
MIGAINLATGQRSVSTTLRQPGSAFRLGFVA